METNTESNRIEFRNVSLSFDETKVLNNINLALEPGEMIFITGTSGSGKSVLLRLAIGLNSPDEGQVLLEGRDIATFSEDQLLELRSRRMGMIFQEDSVFTGLSVFDNVAFRLVEHEISDEEIERLVKEVLRFVGLENDSEKLPAELSGGMRRRLELARALVGWPAIMLFDEPASGLDPLTAIQVLDLIIRARDIYGISSLYVTKKLDEIPYLATHHAVRTPSGEIVIEEIATKSPAKTEVIVLDAGEIVFTGTVDEFESSTLPEVVQLRDAYTETVSAHLNISNPWDKSRQPISDY